MRNWKMPPVTLKVRDFISLEQKRAIMHTNREIMHPHTLDYIT